MRIAPRSLPRCGEPDGWIPRRCAAARRRRDRGEGGGDLGRHRSECSVRLSALSLVGDPTSPVGLLHLVDGRHLVLVGINFTHRRATGDKNFWATLLPGLTAAIERITVISVRPSASPRDG